MIAGILWTSLVTMHDMVSTANKRKIWAINRVGLYLRDLTLAPHLFLSCPNQLASLGLVSHLISPLRTIFSGILPQSCLTLAEVIYLS